MKVVQFTDDSEQQPGFLALIMQSRWCGSIQGPEEFNKCSLNNGQPRQGDYQLPILNFFATISSSFKCGSHHSEVFHSTTMMVTVCIERNSKTAPQNVAHSIHDSEKKSCTLYAVLVLISQAMQQTEKHGALAWCVKRPPSSACVKPSPLTSRTHQMWNLFEMCDHLTELKRYLEKEDVNVCVCVFFCGPRYW